MESSTSVIGSSISSSTYSIGGGPTEKRKEVDPLILADLKTCEYCDIETLLEVFLKRCSLPEQPPPGQNPSTPHMPSTENTPDGSPASTSTVRASGPVQQNGSPNPNPEASPSDPPTLLQYCLELVLPHCQDEELLKLLEELRVFSHIIRLEPLGLRPVSDLNVLFDDSHAYNICWRNGSIRPPDLAILSLSGARRLYGVSIDNWTTLTEELLSSRPCSKVEWPDVLMNVEAEWNVHPIPEKVSNKYGVGLSVNVNPLLGDGNRLDLAANSSTDMSNNSTSASAILSDSAATLDSVEILDSISASGSAEASRSVSSLDLPPPPNPNYSSTDSEVPNTTSAAKRSCGKLADSSNLPAKKQKRNNEVIEKIQDAKRARREAVAQASSNGAAMLHCSLGRLQALGLVIIDSTLWVWWHDRQGAIESTGIDFVQDLPYLLVLLLALGRFTLADWGFNEALDTSILPRHGLAKDLSLGSAKSNPPSLVPTDRNQQGLPGNSQSRQKKAIDDAARHPSPRKGKKRSASNRQRKPHGEDQEPGIQFQTTTELIINPKLKIRYNSPVLHPVHAPFCSKGRATTAFGVTDALDMATNSDNSAPYVAKVYWPHHGRRKEEDMIEDARRVDKSLHNHLPETVGSYDIDPIGTLRIRTELGIHTRSPCQPRGLRIVIFVRLMCITDLKGDEFMIALVECMRCHYVLWTAGICHLDISLSNLMARYVNGHYHGVLNDWDLSSQGTDESRKGLTATVPFTAINLLGRMVAGDSNINRFYRYEAESFFWSMNWRFLAYPEKIFCPLPSVVDWQTGHPRTSLALRCLFLTLPHYKPHDEWSAYYGMHMSTIQWVNNRCVKTNMQETPETPETNLELLRSFLEIVRRRLGDKMPDIPTVKGL
ncbi:unnamed protein product [Rhizoctonia solani]|uniref:Fungal-type protein kinase domain-containing protein n=1 Tax=Rhizoctonia solani TaxID=456999 RepID=A0A8H3DYQ9_9AGAM|nr:unnamed protein product [Rhizoctonia solani]